MAHDLLNMEVLPEERLAKVIIALSSLSTIDLKTITMTEMAALISPYLQIELEESAHHERILCLSDFYGLREKLVERERKSFQKKAELLLAISNRPEAVALGLRFTIKEQASSNE